MLWIVFIRCNSVKHERLTGDFTMNASEKFAQICRISTIINDLNMMGITITVGSDFNEYKLIREKQENRSNIYPMFDSTCSFVDHTNGF